MRFFHTDRYVLVFFFLMMVASSAQCVPAGRERRGPIPGCGLAVKKPGILAGSRKGRTMNIILETGRLVLRKFKPGDAQALFENHRDGEVRKWFPNECYADAEEARNAILFYARCVDSGRLPYVLAAELTQTGELIGDAGISLTEGRTDETEIGYCIGEPFRGRGYAPEIVAALSAFAAGHLGVRAIDGRVLHGNTASSRVLEKCGYRFMREESGAEDDPYGKGMLVYRKWFREPGSL